MCQGISYILEKYSTVGRRTHNYNWTMSGEPLRSAPLAEFAAVHDIEPRQLLGTLLLAQAAVGWDPQPLVLATGTADMLLALTPRLWSTLLH